MRTALGVMVRAPSDPGKTRLAPHLVADRLVALRAALLADAVQTAATVNDVDPFMFVSGGAAGDCLLRAMPIVAQAGGDLGARMRAALAHLLVDGGYDAAMLVGTDVPFLRALHMSDARETLATNDGIVLGPADDGGYYLIGMTQVHADLFEDIAWSTESVLTDTLRAAERLGVEARLLPSLYDIDTIEDLQRAERDLATAPPDVAPNLRAWFLGN